MAYRKVGAPKKAVGAKKRHHPRHHKGRVGAASSFSGMLQVIGGLTIGGAAGRELAILLGKFFPALAASPMIDGVIQMAAGYFLPKFVKGTFMQFLGYGMIASGGQTFIVGTGIINGSTMAYRIGGTSNLRVIGGTSNLRVIGAPGDNRIQNLPNPSSMGMAKPQGFRYYGEKAA